MARRPELAGLVAPYAERLLSDRWCLVHGDFSPKNVLVGDGRLWVIDLEVAHFGNGVFDVAFMLNHLLLKAIRSPADAGALRDCGVAFRNAVAPRDERDLLGHVGCLMLARVHGKSPAEYLDEEGRAAAGALGESLLREPPPSVEAAWERLP
jgi:Ser/Thr protein kinase RdoA (MazF antagonist)